MNTQEMFANVISIIKLLAYIRSCFIFSHDHIPYQELMLNFKKQPSNLQYAKNYMLIYYNIFKESVHQ